MPTTDRCFKADAYVANPWLPGQGEPLRLEAIRSTRSLPLSHPAAILARKPQCRSLRRVGTTRHIEESLVFGPAVAANELEIRPAERDRVIACRTSTRYNHRQAIFGEVTERPKVRHWK